MMELEQEYNHNYANDHYDNQQNARNYNNYSLEQKYGRMNLKRQNSNRDHFSPESKFFNDLDETCDSMESVDRIFVRKSLKKSKVNTRRDKVPNLFNKRNFRSQKFQTEFRLKDLDLMGNQFDKEMVGQYRRTTSKNIAFFDPAIHKRVQMIENQMYLYKKDMQKMQ